MPGIGPGCKSSCRYQAKREKKTKEKVTVRKRSKGRARAIQCLCCSKIINVQAAAVGNLDLNVAIIGTRNYSKQISW